MTALIEHEVAETKRAPALPDPEVVDEICSRIINGESLRAICEDEHMPSKSTVLLWAQHEPFSDQYARAREISGEADADDVAHYSRQAARGEIDPAAATAAINGLKWSAGKRQPKKYGDKLTHASDPDNPILPPATIDPATLSDKDREFLRRLVLLARSEGAQVIEQEDKG